MDTTRIKKTTIDILDTFLGLPETIISSFDRKEFYKVLRGEATEQCLTVTNICKIFHNFKKSGYIEVSNINGNESIKFTNKAKLLVIDKLANKYSVDNKFRFVSFDVPERLKINRDQFRRAIKRMGFVQIQKSLWVTQQDIGELVEMVAEEYKINDYLVYIISNKTNIDDYIKTLTNKKNKI